MDDVIARWAAGHGLIVQRDVTLDPATDPLAVLDVDGTYRYALIRRWSRPAVSTGQFLSTNVDARNGVGGPAGRSQTLLRLDTPGQRYRRTMTEPLPADVALVLEAVLSKDDPIHLALRRQVPHIRVRSRCTCGCGTAYFELDRNAVDPAPSESGTVVAAEAQIVMDDGQCPGEVLVFAQAGYLAWLEVCSWSDDVDVTLATAQRLLCP